MSSKTTIKEKKTEKTPPPYEETLSGEKLTITIIPRTWIIAPIMPKENIRRWAKIGFIKEEEGEHIDRAFPRLDDGKPFLHKLSLKAVLRRAYERLSLEDPTIAKISKKDILNFSIVDDKGRPIDYIVINDVPLKYTRSISGSTAETFEYLDGTFRIQFNVVTRYPKEFVTLLAYGGEYIGMGPRTKLGYGRFRIQVSPFEQKTTSNQSSQ